MKLLGTLIAAFVELMKYCWFYVLQVTCFIFACGYLLDNQQFIGGTILCVLLVSSAAVQSFRILAGKDEYLGLSFDDKDHKQKDNACSFDSESD